MPAGHTADGYWWEPLWPGPCCVAPGGRLPERSVTPSTGTHSICAGGGEGRAGLWAYLPPRGKFIPGLQSPRPLSKAVRQQTSAGQKRDITGCAPRRPSGRHAGAGGISPRRRSLSLKRLPTESPVSWPRVPEQEFVPPDCTRHRKPPPTWCCPPCHLHPAPARLPDECSVSLPLQRQQGGPVSRKGHSEAKQVARGTMARTPPRSPHLWGSGVRGCAPLWSGTYPGCVGMTEPVVSWGGGAEVHLPTWDQGRVPSLPTGQMGCREGAPCPAPGPRALAWQP